MFVVFWCMLGCVVWTTVCVKRVRWAACLLARLCVRLQTPAITTDLKHSSTEIAYAYRKRPYVLTLTTSDGWQCLYQTASQEDMLLWIEKLQAASVQQDEVCARVCV
eukprot:Opistho-1_new@420